MPPSLASRLLFHAAPPPHLLASEELSAEVYELIALALRAYVSPWWCKITRYDRDLLPQITNILAHVIRVLDARMQAQDPAPLLLCDLPAIITQHYTDYRNAASKMNTAYATGGAASLPALFAALQPHMAISANAVIDREYYRQILDRVLALCLPDEDNDPDAERIIVREVLLRLLVDDILPKITQPWFIQSSLLDLIGDAPEPITQPSNLPPFSYHSLVVLALSALQAFSGFCLALIDAYKHALKLVHHSSPPSPAPPPPPPPPAPPRATPSIASSHSSFVAPSPHPPAPHPPYAHAPLLLLAALVSADARLASSVLLFVAHALAAAFAPLLDRLLPAALDAALAPPRVLNIVKAAKRALFPGGYPGPAPPEPTLEEQAALRARVLALRPPASALLTPLLLGPDPAATLGAALDPLSDQQCNLRLAVFILDRVLLELFPELAGAP